jgi:hypothetical protein
LVDSFNKLNQNKDRREQFIRAQPAEYHAIATAKARGR